VSEYTGNPGTEGQDNSVPPHGERAVVLVPVTRNQRKGAHDAHGRDSASRVAEAVGLAEAIDLDVVEGIAVPLAEFRPATLFGSGKVDEIAGKVGEARAGLVIVDHALTPVQQRNLEKAWKAKVIDRTGLILEIFGERARTREGSLQVELAHLNYQKGRLVRSWTHLERQRGGFGFLGGPGETQIEADRRVITDRITKIERELETVATRRRLQRANRKRSNQPVVALVGYTNAGKSTLFNTLTKAEVFADNRLFATLDPTLRRIVLPRGSVAILSDTVGFVADLPTTLVAAFRATLEEVLEADLILHVRDIADPDTEAQAADVAKVLGELGIDAADHDRILEVWNKIDLIPPDRRPTTPIEHADQPAVFAISALTGEGVPALLAAVEARLTASQQIFKVSLTGEGLAKLHRLYDFGEVLDRKDRADGTTVATIRVGRDTVDRFRSTFPGAAQQAVTTTSKAAS
jgi:GTP-binding protein HflX